MDRYTVVFTGRYRDLPHGEFMYLAMNAHPFHPQGIGQHGYSQTQIDANKAGWPPAMGGYNHLGKRIPFDELPDDCKRLVLQDYREIWKIAA